MKKSVVIVEDDILLQAELISILKKAPDIDCWYAVGSGEEALLRLPKRLPDVVLMDIRLPGVSGIRCVEILKKNNPSLEIVMLTIYQDSESIFQALKAGANGYLIKATDPNSLYEAIRNVHSGGAPFTGHIARMIVQHFRSDLKAVPSDQSLSARELQVLELLSAGYLYREVGTDLGITFDTVKSHVRNICRKLHVRNRSAAIAKHSSSQHH